MKKGRKTAVKLFDVEADAEAMLAALSKEHYIQPRPGEARKCKDYCVCCDYCNFYRSQVMGREEAAE